MDGLIIERLGADWRARLFSMLDRQQTVSVTLMDRCVQQAEYLTSERAGALLTVLEERQGLIEELNELSVGLEPFRNAWPEIWGVLDDAERGEVQEMVRGIQQVVNDVMERDADDQKSLQAEKSRLQEELGSMNTARDSQRAYGRPIHRGVEPVTNRFTDRQG